MHRPARVVLAAAVALLVAGIASAMAFDAPNGAVVAAPAPVVEPAAAPTPTATAPPPTAPPTTRPPGPFRSVEPSAEVRAVRTGAGFVLPVVGGGPAAWEVRTPCGATARVAGEPVAGAHVVLDPGHGGSEPGAVGPSGLTEKELNLDIARRVADRLRAKGAVVVLTRDRDVRVTLQTRGEIARSLRPLVFVSIHHNAAPIGRSATPGSELYHQLADPESRRLAGLLWEELQAHLTPFGTDWAVGDQPGARARRSSHTGDDYYGVLRHSQGVPAVLTEAAYLSHPPEDALLRTGPFRDAEADAITAAILRLVTTEDPGSGYAPVKEVATPAGGGGGTTGCEDPPLG